MIPLDSGPPAVGLCRSVAGLLVGPAAKVADRLLQLLGWMSCSPVHCLNLDDSGTSEEFRSPNDAVYMGSGCAIDVSKHFQTNVPRNEHGRPCVCRQDPLLDSGVYDWESPGRQGNHRTMRITSAIHHQAVVERSTPGRDGAPAELDRTESRWMATTKTAPSVDISRSWLGAGCRRRQRARAS